MRGTRALLGYAAFLLGIAGCNAATPVDGSASASHGTLAATTAGNSVAPSYLADAPPPRMPPQQAFDVCKSLSEDAACSVSLGGQAITGICRKGATGEGELVCSPTRPPGPPESGSEQTLTGRALERQLDQLEREIRGS